MHIEISLEYLAICFKYWSSIITGKSSYVYFLTQPSDRQTDFILFLFLYLTYSILVKYYPTTFVQDPTIRQECICNFLTEHYKNKCKKFSNQNTTQHDTRGQRIYVVSSFRNKIYSSACSIKKNAFNWLRHCNKWNNKKLYSINEFFIHCHIQMTKNWKCDIQTRKKLAQLNLFWSNLICKQILIIVKFS